MQQLIELREIRERVGVNPRQVGEGTKRKFWKIVGAIKRDSETPEENIILAAEIRDIFYHHKLGYPKSLSWLLLWIIGGVLCVLSYLWTLTTPAWWLGDPILDTWIHLFWQYSSFMGAIFCFYPFGRLLASYALGIKMDGITRDIYYLPTLKINYITYLKAKPTSRMWFFFFAGIWTVITGLWVGFLGLLIGGDWVGILIAVVLGLLEWVGIYFGGKWAGEMGHFRRERIIVRDIKRMKVEKLGKN